MRKRNRPYRDMPGKHERGRRQADERKSRQDHSLKPGQPSSSGHASPRKRPYNAPREEASFQDSDRSASEEAAVPHSDRHPGGRDRKSSFRPRKPWRPAARDNDGPVFLYGWHSVKAALENPARKFHRILATENALHRLRALGAALPVEPELVRAEAIDALVGPDAVHQGVLVEADPLSSPDIENVPASGIILVLDQITDPHNVGAILRSAAAFGITSVVTTQRHAPEATGVLAKAASGALDLVPIVAVPNLARALTVLKNNNVFVIGLDSEGDGDLRNVPLRAPLALVVGAEGKGLRHLTRTICDQVVRLDLPGKIKSLNVSNATALAIYIAASRIANEPGSGGAAG